MPPYKPVIITTTAADRDEAQRIGAALLEKKLAACVQYEIIWSHYEWQGEMHIDGEIRLTIKSARCHYAAVEKTIRALHSYECPQILMQPVSRCFTPYLRWAKAALGL